MMQLILVVGVFIALLAVMFAMQNNGVITVVFLMWDFNCPVSLLLLITFGLGILASILFSLPAYLKREMITAGLKKKIKELEKNLAEHIEPAVKENPGEFRENIGGN